MAGHGRSLAEIAGSNPTLVMDICVWRSRERASLMYSFKYNQQDATL